MLMVLDTPALVSFKPLLHMPYINTCINFASLLPVTLAVTLAVTGTEPDPVTCQARQCNVVMPHYPRTNSDAGDAHAAGFHNPERLLPSG
eukprot:366113-Chlamydomonas_euryale.AAC.11